MTRKLRAGVIVMAGVACGATAGIAHAQSGNDELRQKIDALQRQIDELRAQLPAAPAAPAGAPAPAPAPVAAAPAPAAAGEAIQRKPGEGFTILTRGGEATIYANLDVSLDTSTKGFDHFEVDGVPPPGKNGWMTDISSNISYVGIRGFQHLGDFPANFIYQLETQIDVSASSGSSASNSNTSSVVKGGLTSRNSYIGLGAPAWGAVKIGKTDAPYKNSTSNMNPFNGMWGDYAVIMGNSGGDNRVEFGTRLDHSIWYESPTFAGGLQFNLLVSPGQNRASDNSNLAAGEVDCTGGNIPGSGGTPAACNDGAFGTAYSTDLAYRNGGFYAAAAYELHKGVNRTSDLPTWDAGDIADEWAAKIGAQYRFSTGTTVSAIYEKLKRDVPARLAYQDERSRNGTWLALSQQFNDKDSLHFGWAHAGATPGDPGQHNTPGGANPDNEANMFTLAWKHQVDKNFMLYTDFAETLNHVAAHFDLGAGGRSVTTDCHDASNPDTSGFDPNGDAPHCWAGAHPKGFSIGAKYTY
jgi:predicted porin